VSDDVEMLLPWYGPRAFAAEVAAAAWPPQQQGAEAAGRQAGGSGPSSGRRRRPRSGSDDGSDDDDAEQQQPQPEPGTSGAADADADAPPQRRVGAAGVSGAADSIPRSSSSGGSSAQHWWDELSGGRGRLSQRCIGHCNVQTDIKEAVFLGQDDALVAAGSDDGCVFIYDAATGALCGVLCCLCCCCAAWCLGPALTRRALTPTAQALWSGCWLLMRTWPTACSPTRTCPCSRHLASTPSCGCGRQR
jgi:hypothetical protein